MCVWSVCVCLCVCVCTFLRVDKLIHKKVQVAHRVAHSSVPKTGFGDIPDTPPSSSSSSSSPLFSTHTILFMPPLVFSICQLTCNKTNMPFLCVLVLIGAPNNTFPFKLCFYIYIFIWLFRVLWPWIRKQQGEHDIYIYLVQSGERRVFLVFHCRK